LTISVQSFLLEDSSTLSASLQAAERWFKWASEAHKIVIKLKVNASGSSDCFDYACSLRLQGVLTRPFLPEAASLLPDSLSLGGLATLRVKATSGQHRASESSPPNLMTKCGARRPPQSDSAHLSAMRSALRRHARCARALGCVLAATPPFSLRKRASSKRRWSTTLKQ
jgi:hypothetical protein